MPDHGCGERVTEVVTGWDKFMMIHNDIFWLIIALMVFTAVTRVMFMAYRESEQRMAKEKWDSEFDAPNNRYELETERIRVQAKWAAKKDE